MQIWYFSSPVSHLNLSILEIVSYMINYTYVHGEMGNGWKEEEGQNLKKVRVKRHYMWMGPEAKVMRS